MPDILTQLLSPADSARLCAGEVVDVNEFGSVVVRVDGRSDDTVTCQMLSTSDDSPPTIVAGDRVLTWIAPGQGEAVVVGRIGPSRAPLPDPDEIPETLTLEATQSLTLRVGNGSITIREDGKILIKGTDLVSQAQRTNRIRGGAVAIN